MLVGLLCVDVGYVSWLVWSFSYAYDEWEHSLYRCANCQRSLEVADIQLIMMNHEAFSKDYVWNFMKF